MTELFLTTRDYEARTPMLATSTKVNEIKVQETTEMLLYEELAKARIQELDDVGRGRWWSANVLPARKRGPVARWVARRSYRRRR